MENNIPKIPKIQERIIRKQRKQYLLEINALERRREAWNEFKNRGKIIFNKLIAEFGKSGFFGGTLAAITRQSFWRHCS